MHKESIEPATKYFPSFSRDLANHPRVVMMLELIVPDNCWDSIFIQVFLHHHQTMDFTPSLDYTLA